MSSSSTEIKTDNKFKSIVTKRIQDVTQDTTIQQILSRMKKDGKPDTYIRDFIISVAFKTPTNI